MVHLRKDAMLEELCTDSQLDVRDAAMLLHIALGLAKAAILL